MRNHDIPRGNKYKLRLGIQVWISSCLFMIIIIMFIKYKYNTVLWKIYNTFSPHLNLEYRWNSHSK